MKRMMLVVLVSLSLALPAFGRERGSMGGGRSAMGGAISGARMGGGHSGSGGGFQGALSGPRDVSGGFQGALSGPRGVSGGYRGGGGFQGAVTIPRSSTGPMRGASGGFRGSLSVPGTSGSGFSFSRPSGFPSRLGSGGWFSSAFARDFSLRRHYFNRDFFVLSFGYPFLNLYYPFYGSFALGFGYWWYPYYYPFYAPYFGYPYYPYYPYGYYPGYVYPPPYDNEAPPQTSSLGDQLTMQWQRGGGLLVAWSGRAAKVKQVEFSLLDSHHQLLTLQVARRAPYRTTFASPADEALYLQMAVVYADGSVDSVIRRIPDTGTATGAGYY